VRGAEFVPGSLFLVLGSSFAALLGPERILITGILLEVREQQNRPAALGNFYARRFLRIFPAFYLTLLLAWWADVPPLRETLRWHAAYLSNVQIVLTESWPGAISQFWSLAVEEQFYLLWPGLIVFVPRRWLLSAVVASVLAAPLFRWWLATLGYRENLLAVLTPGSMDSLGMGALLAVMVARRSPESIPAATAARSPNRGGSWPFQV
jgi:peptidoglycan/LPS O-acetylase OafA/YrhL